MPKGQRTLDCFNGTNLGADYSDEEREFLVAIDRYKRSHQRPFPTWREVLAILTSLGWRKVAEVGPLPSPEQIHPSETAR